MTRRMHPHPHREPPKSRADLCSQAGAEGLAQQLKAYWHAEGYPLAHFWVMPARFEGKCQRNAGELMFVVRSNLIGGIPPK